MSDTALCLAPRCHVPGWHTQDCDSQKCRGCLPAVADHGQFCEHHAGKLADILDQIPQLYAALDLVPGTGEPAPIGRSGSESRPPVRVDVLSEIGPGAAHVCDPHDQEGHLPAAYHLQQIAEDWASYRSEVVQAGLPSPYVPALCDWLLANREWALRYHPAIDEAYDLLVGIRNRLRTLVNGIELAEWSGPLPGRCPQCRRLSLVVDRGRAECRHDTCGRIWADERQPVA